MPPTICLSIQNAKVEKEHNSDQNLIKSSAPWFRTACKILWALLKWVLRYFAYKTFTGLSLKRSITPPWRLQQKRKTKLTTGHNSRSIWQYLFKCLSGHLLLTNNLFTRFQGSSFNSFWDIVLTRFHPCFLRAISQERHITLTIKKTCQLFFMRNPYLKFQNPSMHSSNVRLCIKVCNVKMPKMTKSHNSRSTFQNLFKS